ncbi:MAG: hypothetical protein ABIE94_02065 [archaeon]
MGKPIKYYPLSSGFMLVAIIGFIVSIVYYDSFGHTWGFTLALFFIIMFIAGMITMTRAPIADEHMDALAAHELPKQIKKKKKQ